MNLLLADSGSTKTEWRLLQNGIPGALVTSIGLNPQYMSDEAIRLELNDLPSTLNAPVDAICFYGSGCYDRDTGLQVSTALQSLFSKARIEIHSDLLGAARALCQHTPGVACILGTGSNSCYFDGTRIADQIPTLGFILGDEASAGYFGRKILQAYFYRELPEPLSAWLQSHYDMRREAVLESFRQTTRFNTLAGSYATLLGAFPEHDYVQLLLRGGFEEFIRRHVAKYQVAPGTPVAFTGSVAWHHRVLLRTTLERLGFTPGSIIQKPMDGLIAWHQSEPLG